MEGEEERKGEGQGSRRVLYIHLWIIKLCKEKFCWFGVGFLGNNIHKAFLNNNQVTVLRTGGKIVHTHTKRNKNSWDFITLLSAWYMWFCLLLIFFPLSCYQHGHAKQTPSLRELGSV